MSYPVLLTEAIRMANMLVTIGLCVKNCEKTVGSTLDSIMSQDYSRNLMEIIVVDDDCDDNTISIVVEKLAKADIEFWILQTGGNGLGAARQKVVDHAKGKYIVWIDGDIIIPPDHISKQVEFMESHSRVGKARANWGWFETGKVVGDLQFLAYVDEVRSGIQSKMAGTGGSICRVNAIKDAGGFDIHITGAWEDVDLAIRMLARGWDFSVSDTFFFHKPKTSWKDLWNQYLWYGYGGHYVSHKHHMKSICLVRTLPVVLAISIKKATIAFKFTGKKISFLLPVSFLIRSLAWWTGFTKAHLEKYNPTNMH